MVLGTEEADEVMGSANIERPSTRADRIYKIVNEAGGRLQAAEIARRLAKRENVRDLATSTVSATVAQDNKTRDSSGRTPRFSTYGDGDEEWGFISIRKTTHTKQDLTKLHGQIPQIIESANETTRRKLKDAISKLTWQQFESNFLVRVLEALGFRNVALTQATRDGGKDAECQYERGVVASKAIVSAKHWQKLNVPVMEVQRLRGIQGNADTAVIVTSSSFTADAKKEAMPGQNIRSIVLIDGDLIVETCMSHKIGVRSVDLPTLYDFTGFETEAPD